MATSRTTVMRLVLAAAGLLLLVGGLSVAHANTGTLAVCAAIGDCPEEASPALVTPLRLVSAVGGPLLMLVALLVRPPAEDRRTARDVPDDD